MKVLIFLLSVFVTGIFAESAFTVSTFHSLSIYWTPTGGTISKTVNVEYKSTADGVWKSGLSMKYNPIPQSGNNTTTGIRMDKADYRGSIVNLIPNTNYDIKLTLEGTATTTTIQAKTWSEDFPIGQTITPGNINTQYTVTESGTANGYVLIDGTFDTIDIQDASEQCIYLQDVEYVIIRGYTLTNGNRFGIRLINCNHIVIENCDISAWGQEDVIGTGFGKGYQAAIMGYGDAATSSVFQRNKIHHPKWDANSWAEMHDPSENSSDLSSFHPDGPQGISIGGCVEGNMVIRYNEFWSDTAHYFNDVMGYGPNGSYNGFPGPDSDIYGNYVANCFDDGIESEGSNTNVRIWNNYIEEVFIAMANAATSIGPLYIWRNITGRAFSHEGSVYGTYGGFLKMGYASSIDWMTGHMYIFNNTILQEDNHGTGGLGTSDGANRYIKHCETRNNIFNVREETTNSIAIRSSGNEDNNYDYDLTNHPFPIGHEVNGLTGIPTYINGLPSFDFETMTGNFQLSSSSLGYDAGCIIPNFCDSYLGNAPDMGAHESGANKIIYGVKADSVSSAKIVGNTKKKESLIFNVFPTPSLGLFTIDLPKIQVFSANVFDVSGKRIMKFKGPFLNSTMKIDLQKFPKAIYFLKINWKNKSKTIPLIKM